MRRFVAFLLVFAVLSPISILSARAVDSFDSVLLRELNLLSPEIDLSSKNINQNRISDMYFSFLHRHPELFWVSFQLEYKYKPANNMVSIIQPVYSLAKRDLPAKKAAFDRAVDEMMKKIPKNAPVAHQIVAANDALCLRGQYDTTTTRTTAYDLLVDGTATCEGYTAAMNLLLQKRGIQSVRISSKSINHTWNMVKCGGKWYHVDVTWNDPVPDRQGIAGHSQILMSDTQARNTEHTGWLSDFTAPDKTYDNIFGKTNRDTIWVAFNPVGGTLSGKTTARSLCQTNGKKLRKPTVPKRKGYKFLGWYTAKTGGKPYTGGSVATVYAHWKKVS